MLNKIKVLCSTSLLLILFFFFFFFSGCSKTVTVSDGKFSYETVKGDPLKARIYTLDNGLKVYLTLYKETPRIQTAIAVKAGGKYDPPEATGMAHYLEHMLFKGTDEFGTRDWNREKVEIEKIIHLFDLYCQTTDSLKRKAIYHQIDSVSFMASTFTIANEYDKMLNSVGATGTNAFTSEEQTVYINNIPGNQFEKWLLIEYERFKDVVLRLFHTELEVVYEEKNRSLDSDGRKANEALMTGLFQNHPYGTQTVIGSIEHLKNPPMRKVIEYYNTYYVPNNMAICLSGDFDPDSMVTKINQTFGQLTSSPVPDFISPVEKTITKPVIKEIWGPEAESVIMAFRFPGISSLDVDLLTMVDMILMNSTAGLIDLNLNQKQKVLGASSYVRKMKDYSYHGFAGRAREEQELEEVIELILEQIDLIKKGDFPDWLPEAVVTDLKLNQIRGYESNWARSFSFVQAFTMDIPWEKSVYTLDRLAKISKRDIVDFAKKHYQDNYVVVYKRTGEDKNVKKVTKPKITPVELNRSDQSDFVSNILNMEVEDIEPVFLDYEKDFKKLMIKQNIPLFYKQNQENEIFALYYILDMGLNHNNRIAVALDYLRYLGTSQYSLEEINQKFYKLGCSFGVSDSRDQIWVSLSGLRENFEQALELFEHLLADALPNHEALENLKKDIFKNRTDAKLSKSRIGSAMRYYGKYGPKSPLTNVLSEEEIKALQAEELIKIIKTINSYEHRVLYYGPDDDIILTSHLNRFHNIPGLLRPVPEPKRFVNVPTDVFKVYVVDYDMKQAEIQMLSRSIPFNRDNHPIRRLFNEYYGGSMSSVVFQTMRESKALAYSVNASYQNPPNINEPFYISAYIGTQVDKLPEALAGFFDLLTYMPESEKSLSESKEAILNRIRTSRITKQGVLFNYETARRFGYEHDTRKDLYAQVPEFSLDDIKDFFDVYIKDKKYNIMVLADVDQLDIEALSLYGEVTYLTLEEIFGY